MNVPSCHPWLSKCLIIPPKYIQASVIISIGGILFGLDTGTIGPLTVMPQFYETFGTLSSTVHGLVVSTILIPAAFSSIFTGHLANALGRLAATAIGSFIFGIGAAIECSSFHLPQLFVGRAIKGLGEGFFLSTLTVYITEISPPSRRGTLASLPQLATTLGCLVGYFMCYGSVDIGSSLSWRLPFAVQAVIAFLFTASTLLFLPQSPRWLAARGKFEEAERVWLHLAVPEKEREGVKQEVDDNEKADQEVKTKDLFAIFAPDAWKRTVLGLFLMAMQQAAGIDGVLYYAPLLFQAAGLTSSAASFLASGISALLIFLTTIPTFILADKWGRRTSTIVGGVGQVIVMFIIASLYASDSVHSSYGAGRWVVIICIYLFAIIFAATWAVTFKVYVSEIQSAKTRAGATSLSLSANWVVNWIIAFTTPIFLAKSASGCYWLWGSAALVTVIVAMIFMPETKGKSLEEIDASFRRGDIKATVSEGGVVELGSVDGLGDQDEGPSERDDKHNMKVTSRVVVATAASSSFV
ncbi:f0fdf6b1-29f2-4650-b445-73daea91c3f7 [Sclerotinia trifoliorum]|uniref:F0fdf6b1-29f2-4650-b445-73daea91c3f7 n=1 Tax=Sclerotinia trifoliorum TaxID=28548 RepID=A0A8H2W1U8_9HELO|nr:f0fdf6b1-29f2-4650-b445-73daea91c3f7 [Sclerotinia trifoliorum]